MYKKLFVICILLTFVLYSFGYNKYEGSYESLHENYFYSTSTMKSGVNYNTVQPLSCDGTVSNNYMVETSSNPPRNIRRGLDLDDGDTSIGVPIGDAIVPLLILLLLYMFYDLFIKHMLKK